MHELSNEFRRHHGLPLRPATVGICVVPGCHGKGRPQSEQGHGLCSIHEAEAIETGRIVLAPGFVVEVRP